MEPHNHRVNAAERAIQTFKNRFIGTLDTTDVDFPIQLWDKLTPQVQDPINLLCRLRIKPNVSTYEALKGPYNWNRYPMAPLGSKAITFEDSDRRASWAPHGLNAWILGPSKDHYRCHLFYVPETRGYRESGLANLFPQHCMAPKYTPKLHIKELSKELQTNLKKLARKHHNIDVTKMLAHHLNAYIVGTLLAVILGDPYAKKFPLPHIGVTSCLPVSPSIPYHRILGQSCLLNRSALPHTLSRRVPLG